MHNGKIIMKKFFSLLLIFTNAVFLFSQTANLENTNSQMQNSPTINSQTQNSPITNLQTQNSSTTNSQTQNSPTINSQPQNSPITNLQTQNSSTTNSQTQNSPTTNLQTQNSPTANSQMQNSPTANSQTQKKQKKDSPKQLGQDALVLYQNGDYKAAIAVCEDEIRKNQGRVDSYVVLCWSLVKNKQYAEAEERAAEGLKTNPYDLRLIEIFGEAKYYLGKNNGALEQFQKYAASAPEGSSRLGTAFYFMGEIYIRQARYQHADIAFSAAVKKEPLIAFWWTRLGYAREMAGNYSESLSAYDEALLLDATSTDAKNGKARVSSILQ